MQFHSRVKIDHLLLQNDAKVKFKVRVLILSDKAAFSHNKIAVKKIVKSLRFNVVCLFC